MLLSRTCGGFPRRTSGTTTRRYGPSRLAVPSSSAGCRRSAIPGRREQSLKFARPRGEGPSSRSPGETPEREDRLQLDRAERNPGLPVVEVEERKRSRRWQSGRSTTGFLSDDDDAAVETLLLNYHAELKADLLLTVPFAPPLSFGPPALPDGVSPSGELRTVLPGDTNDLRRLRGRGSDLAAAAANAAWPAARGAGPAGTRCAPARGDARGHTRGLGSASLKCRASHLLYRRGLRDQVPKHGGGRSPKIPHARVRGRQLPPD